MPGARLPMRKIRDMLQLTAAGMSSRKIAASLSIGGTTVVDCLRRARAVGVAWPLPEDLSDAALEARLFPASMALAAIKSRRTQADWPAIHRELKRPGVTLQLVWEEHRTAHPEGYGYGRCENALNIHPGSNKYNQLISRPKPVFRRGHDWRR
jgi:hypothetical protein